MKKGGLVLPKIPEHTMAIPVKIRKKVIPMSMDRLAQIGEKARLERERLLREHPHLRAYQEEIDRMMAGAGSAENRMAVLGLMMETKLNELRDQLSRLSECLQAVERR